MDNIINPGSKKETLETVYMPPSSYDAVKLFCFLRSHVTLESNGMGVSLKESRASLSELMEKEGFEYILYSDFIELYEFKVMEQYSKQRQIDELVKR